MTALASALGAPSAGAGPDRVTMYPVVIQNDVYLFHDRKDAEGFASARCRNAVAMTMSDIRRLKKADRRREAVTLIVRRHEGYITDVTPADIGAGPSDYIAWHHKLGNRSINPACDSRDLYEIKVIVKRP